MEEQVWTLNKDMQTPIEIIICPNKGILLWKCWKLQNIQVSNTFRSSTDVTERWLEMHNFQFILNIDFYKVKYQSGFKSI